MNKEMAMRIANENGGVQYIHCFAYEGSMYIPCQNMEDVKDPDDGSKKKRMYVSRIGVDVFLEDDYIKAKAQSEWNTNEWVWTYHPWAHIKHMQMLDEASRHKVNG